MQNKSRVVMCPPDYYDVFYEINPWMQMHSVDRERARTQWNELFFTYTQYDVKVETIDPSSDFPDMVFTTDHGVHINNTFILSNFKHKERQGETALVTNWLEKNGFNVTHLEPIDCFEGGDCLQFGNKLILGYGFRTCFSTAASLQELLGIEVIPLRLINKKYYHLDTALFCPDDENLFYVAEAFSKEEISKLAKLGKLYDITPKEAENLAANAVRIKDSVIMAPQNQKMKRDLQQLGYETVEVDTSEFKKAGGGIHCLTQCL